MGMFVGVLGWRLGASIPYFIRVSRASLQAQLVSQHRDKLPIGRFILRGAHPAPKGLVQRIHASPVPCHLDGMPDGAFHLAGAQGGAARLLGVEFIAFQLLCLLVLCFPFLL